MFSIMPSFLDTVALSMTSAKCFKTAVDKVLPNSYFTNVPFLGINSQVGFMGLCNPCDTHRYLLENIKGIIYIFLNCHLRFMKFQV